jgi:predicted transcriptional regulator
MSKRILRIGIASKKFIHRRMLDIAKGAYRPAAEEPRVWFTSAEAMARVLSTKNMMLIEMIRDMRPASVTELADKVGRAKSNVLRSLKTLRQFDIVEFEDGRHGRKAPRVNYDGFRVSGQLGVPSSDKEAA